jgi:hypothetical protein
MYQPSMTLIVAPHLATLYYSQVVLQLYLYSAHEASVYITIEILPLKILLNSRVWRIWPLIHTFDHGRH